MEHGARGMGQGRKGEGETLRWGERAMERGSDPNIEQGTSIFEVFVKIREHKAINSIFLELKDFYLVGTDEGLK